MGGSLFLYCVPPDECLYHLWTRGDGDSQNIKPGNINEVNILPNHPSEGL